MNLKFPKQVNKVYIDPYNNLIFELSLQDSKSTRAFPSSVPIISQIKQDEINNGIFIIEKRPEIGNIVLLCSESGCKCAASENLIAGDCNDSLDNDCDGFFDSCDDDCDGNDIDNDGWTNTCGDCDDSNPAMYPGAVELCDGFDNDCKNGIDDNPTDCYGLCTECSAGACIIPANEPACGVIDCDLLDNFTIIGTNEPNGTSICTYKNYNDYVTNQCEDFKDCKDSNTLPDCSPSIDNTITCGLCKYIDSCNNSGQSCATYPDATVCGPNAHCSGGSCVCDAGFCDDNADMTDGCVFRNVNFEYKCFNEDEYWYDNCGTRQALKKDCPTGKCGWDAGFEACCDATHCCGPVGTACLG